MRKLISSLIWAPIFLVSTFFSTLIILVLFQKVFPEKFKVFEGKKPDPNALEIYIYFIGAPATYILFALVYLSPLLAIFLCLKGKLPFSKKKNI